MRGYDNELMINCDSQEITPRNRKNIFMGEMLVIEHGKPFCFCYRSIEKKLASDFKRSFDNALFVACSFIIFLQPYRGISAERAITAFSWPIR